VYNDGLSVEINDVIDAVTIIIFDDLSSESVATFKGKPMSKCLRFEDILLR
jgi:hypothetical protein